MGTAIGKPESEESKQFALTFNRFLLAGANSD